jgi:hypothetical protein
MTFSGLLTFVLGQAPDFHAAEAQAWIQPGEKFGRYQGPDGWIYVEITGLNDGKLPSGRLYAKAFGRRFPHGRAGSCRLSELDLRFDDHAWQAIRRNGWREPGAALNLEELLAGPQAAGSNGAHEPPPDR